MAASRAAVSVVFERLEPSAVEQDAKAPSLLHLNRSDVLWRAYQARHADLATDTAANPRGAVNAAFKQGYERQLCALDEAGTRS